MAEYELVERFVSINGEGTRAGQLALFLRFKGCNLDCSFCDTKWANESDCDYEIMSDEDIYLAVKKSGIDNVTVTGGEPLYRKDMDILLRRLSAIDNIYIEIETNGSVDLAPYRDISEHIAFTMDYKLPYSGMTDRMCHANFSVLGKNDTVKFVAADRYDLDVAYDIIKKYGLAGKTNIYLSPVFGKIEPEEIVSYMIEKKMNKVNMQLQLHKYIWEPDRKGV